jgi:hypothetical protein
MTFRGAVCLALLLGCAACSSNGAHAGGEAAWVTPAPAAEPGGTTVHVTGIVSHLDLEGGFFAIKGDDGTTYDPTNLPAEFQKDGLAVEAEVRRRDDMAGIHQAGPIVDIVRIRAR